jgi:hypothetical protein
VIARPAFDRVVTKLHDVGRRVRVVNANRVQAQCPSHDDQNPSLLVTAIEGKALLLSRRV